MTNSYLNNNHTTINSNRQHRQQQHYKTSAIMSEENTTVASEHNIRRQLCQKKETFEHQNLKTQQVQIASRGSLWSTSRSARQSRMGGNQVFKDNYNNTRLGSGGGGDLSNTNTKMQLYDPAIPSPNKPHRRVVLRMQSARVSRLGHHKNQGIFKNQ